MTGEKSASHGTHNERWPSEAAPQTLEACLMEWGVVLVRNA